MSKKAKARIIRDKRNHTELPFHPTNEYLHWSSTVSDALELRELYDRFVTPATKEDFEKLAYILRQNAARDEADSSNEDL